MQDEQKQNAGLGVSGLMTKPNPATPAQNSPNAQSFGTRAATHAKNLAAQSFDRTVGNLKQTTQAAMQDWQNGNHAKATGRMIGGVLDKGKMPKDLTLDVIETHLGHTIFPAVEFGNTHGIEFAKGLIGWDDKQGAELVKFGRDLFGSGDTPTPAATQNYATGNRPTGGQLNQALSEQALRQAGNTPLTAQAEQKATAQQPTGADLGFSPNRFSNLTPEQAAAYQSFSSSPHSAPQQGLGLNPEMLRQYQSGSLNSNQGNFGLKNINMHTMPNFNNQQPERPFVATFGKTADDNERRALMNAALTPHKGAKNGQLTANQLNVVRGLLESEQRNAIDLQKAQEQLANQYQIAQNNNANALQRDWLQQTGGLNRDALNHFANLQRETLSQQGQNQRNALSASLDLARTAENARQFDLKQAFYQRENQAANIRAEREQALQQRIDDLRERLVNAKSIAEKNAISRELAILSGQSDPTLGGLHKEYFENVKAQRELALMARTDELREKLMQTQDKKERAELSRQLAILTGQM